MDLRSLVQEVTKKPIGHHIGQGFYFITEGQAKLLTDKLPRVGYEKTMKMGDKWGKVVPSTTVGETSYIVSRTPDRGESVWSIRAY